MKIQRFLHLPLAAALAAAAQAAVPVAATDITALPYTISAPGAYELTGNLTGVSGFDGITIASSDVTLDLNGFSLIGVPGSGNGVRLTPFAGYEGIRVENGVIRDWGASGVLANGSSRTTFSHLFLTDNGEHGLRTGGVVLISDCIACGNGQSGFNASGAVLERCIATQNGGIGLDVGGEVRACLSSSNGDDGVNLAGGSIITESVARQNGGDGMSTGVNTTFQDCVATSNDDDGIKAGSTARVTGCLTAANGQHGIEVEDASFVARNLCAKNGLDAGSNGAGILASGANNRLEGNTLLDNDVGLMTTAADNAILLNDCQQNSVAQYVIAAGSAFGAMGFAATSASAFANFIP